VSNTSLEKLKEVAGSWSIYAALGSFILYLLGYLTLRCQLATWGVATDLSVLDERYFFAGARFLVYLVSTIINVLLFASPILLIWLLLNRWSRFYKWREGWNYAVAGVVFALLFVQLVERKCFDFMNSLLVQPQIGGEKWLIPVLCSTAPKYEALFFSALVGGVMATGWFLYQSQSQGLRRPVAELLLSFLFAVELFLLPVNYGVFIATKALARVTTFAPSEAWLVWQGTEKTTFLVTGKNRKLVAIPNSEVRKIEITGVDNIFHRLFP
jgi:hypothetical protein